MCGTVNSEACGVQLKETCKAKNRVVKKFQTEGQRGEKKSIF